MAQLPTWATGRHITNCSITLQTVGANGSLTANTAVSQFYGVLKGVSIEVNVETESISSMDSPNTHNVFVEAGTTVTLKENERYIAGNLSAALMFSGSICSYTIVRGANTFTGYGLLSSYGMDATKPRIDGEIKIIPVDVGTASSQYA